MRITIIAAMDENRLIGSENSLPWNLPSDLKNFKKLTSGHSIIMGRKTWESLGRALPNRQNIVVTRNAEFKADGCIVVHSLEDAIEASSSDEVFIIGGAQIYEIAMCKADKMILTHVHTEAKGDTWFPSINGSKWVLTSLKAHSEAIDEHPYSIGIYNKI